MLSTLAPPAGGYENITTVIIDEISQLNRQNNVLLKLININYYT